MGGAVITGYGNCAEDGCISGSSSVAIRSVITGLKMAIPRSAPTCTCHYFSHTLAHPPLLVRFLSSSTMADNTPQDDAVQHQNPQEHVPPDQLHDVLASDVSRGAAVHSFSPEAPPQAKAAAASEGLEAIIPRAATDTEPVNARGVLSYMLLSETDQHTLCSEVSVDAANGNVLPTISVHDAEKVSKEELEHPILLPPTPGGYPSGLAPVVPDWYKVGWRAVANIDAPPLEEGEEKDKSILALFLSEQFYGAWYHNAALIFFVRLTLFLSHLT